MAKRKSRANPEISERALCAKFIRWAGTFGFTAYPETGGFDIVLVREGIQIGVQAKLTFNIKLLQQIIPVDEFYRHAGCGPHYRAVVTPPLGHELVRDASQIAEFCGFEHFRLIPESDWEQEHFTPPLNFERWQLWPHDERIKLPEYVPDVAAGASGPVQLTEWKIGALRITATLEIKGFVERTDFKRFQVDHRRWTQMGWLAIDDAGRYVRGEKLRFHEQHPRVYQQILAELRKESEVARG